MKKLIVILFLAIPFIVNCQQIGGAGHNKGYYASTCSAYSASDTNIVLVNAGQWYIYHVRFVDVNNKDFSVITSKGFKYTRSQSKEFTFVGTANNESSKSAIVQMQLFVNGTLIQGGRARRTFHNAGDIQGFDVNMHLDLIQNDTIKVMIKSDTPNTTITSYDCNITLTQIQ